MKKKKVSVFRRIREKSDGMSRSHQKVAAYMEAHPDRAPFLTAAQMAQLAGVSEATVIRFATYLGFSGFSEMQKHLREEIRERLTTVERLDLAEDAYPEEQRVVYEVLHDDLGNLQQTMHMLDASAFAEAVGMISHARMISVVAFRSSHALGYFLTFYLNLILENAKLIQQSDTMFEQLSPLRSDDLLIGIGFPRYTARTIQAIQFARSRGVKTLAITDSHGSPLAREAEVYLVATSRLPSFVDSYVAPLSLINALITAVGRKNKAAVSRRLKVMEEVWSKEGIYFPQ